MAGNDQYTKVLLHLNGADGGKLFPDDNAGGSAHTWNAAGAAVLSTTQKKFGTASYYGDGAVGSYLTTPDSADFPFSNADFTVDLWFYPAAGFNGLAGGIAGYGDSFGLLNDSFWLRKSIADNIRADVFFTNSSSITITSTSTFNTQTWNHLALVRYGTGIYMFLNGTQEGGTQAVGTKTVCDSITDMRLGAFNNSGLDGTWHGWLDEFRLSAGIARWTANFTPPTEAFVGPGMPDDGYALAWKYAAPRHARELKAIQEAREKENPKIEMRDDSKGKELIARHQRMEAEIKRINAQRARLRGI